jgi:hypothetical protein
MLNEGIIRAVEFANVPLKGWDILLQVVDGVEEVMQRAVSQLDRIIIYLLIKIIILL